MHVTLSRMTPASQLFRSITDQFSIIENIQTVSEMATPSREQDLKERVVTLERQLKLLEGQLAQEEKRSDILYLNVGGSSNIAVQRSTLTHFQNSMLAERFCRRWDDSLDKDKDGNFFLDLAPRSLDSC